MAVFKCKMCGGRIEFLPGATVGICDSCGTKQTLPRLDDDKKANLYDRANHFRRSNEFDKAMGIYEQILNEDNTDAESYWSLVLCRYGIEYVEDPATHRHVPTVNRAQFTSIYMDEDYKSALHYADESQRLIYQEEANAIDAIQKGILEISSKEQPFDVFICYKETDANGRRTQDSVLATDLYHQLTQEGFRVFFSRITLENKLGVAYEPYIFAALRSSKIMVVLGTKPEYFNAVWVKNEWSRYLALIKNGAKKVLIPAYKDMDPYDLPEEFSHLQAQDMSKLGFMQDLIRGIQKIVGADASREAGVTAHNAAAQSIDTAPLLKRVFLFLEDGNWESADEYCEKVLDIDPENAEAYLGKLMAELHVKRRQDLSKGLEPFDENNNYAKAIRFGSTELQNELSGYCKLIDENCIQEAACQISYCLKNGEWTRVNQYCEKVLDVEPKNAEAYLGKLLAELHVKTIKDLSICQEPFDTKENYRMCVQLADQELKNKISCYANAAKENIYNNAKEQLFHALKISGCKEAKKLFLSLGEYSDASAMAKRCDEKAAELEKKMKERKRRKKKLKLLCIVVPICLICLILLFALVILPAIQYNSAMKLYNEGNYTRATTAFLHAGNYKDSAQKAEECFFHIQKNGLKAIATGMTIQFGFYEQDNDTSDGKEEIEWNVLAVEEDKALLVSKYALDCQPYNSHKADITWEDCTLRAWLNDTFLNDAFSTKHQEQIALANTSADVNPRNDTSPGNVTEDKVFLLSIKEADQYFESNKARSCEPTAYARAKGAAAIDGFGTWWLRSPGYTQSAASFVYREGAISSGGHSVDMSNDCVRPAIWVMLDS